MLYASGIWSQDSLSARSVVIQRDFKASFTPAVNNIPADHYAKHLGFFCKQEIRAEKNNIPIKVRLGSFDYCNWLENKPGYILAYTQQVKHYIRACRALKPRY